MLVVSALALVVAAAVFLVRGLLGGAVGDLSISMALCAASLVVLALSARVGRGRPAAAAAAPPVTLPLTTPEPPSPDVAPSRPVAEAQPPVTAAAPADPAPAHAPVDDAAVWAPPSGPTPFPIADYESLDVSQVLPLIDRLWPEELPVVAARERATRARPQVLDALAAAAEDPSLGFPIADYDRLDTAQITRLLDRLDAAELEVVRAAERAGGARVGVLVAVADQLAGRR